MLWRIGILLLAACSEAPKEAFVVDGFVTEPLHTQASVIGVWQLPTDPVRYYKLGDGVRLNSQFTLGFDTDPPPEALGPDGIGVAYVVMLPELTTVPDGPVSLAGLAILGGSAETAVVYKAGDATGPAWSAALSPRFSCGRCVRDTDPDSFEVIACANVYVENANAPLCDWY